MAGSAKLLLEILVKADDAAAAIDKTGKGVGKFSGGLKKAAVGAGVALGVIGKFAMDAGKSASDLQQSFGGLDAVFGSNADEMKTWAKGAAQSMGLSANAYAEGAAKIGSQLKNLGVPVDQIAGKTNDLMVLGSDLAATYGGTTSDAVDALGAALRGEADPAERYGLALSQTAINAKMAADGTDKLTGKAKQQAKTQALLAMATEQSGGAVGQFARESESAAGASQIAAAQYENTKAALGTALLPVLSAVAKALGEVSKFAQENTLVFQIIIGVIAALAVVILVAAAAQWAMNSALLACPATWIVLAIIAIVVAIVLLWKNCESFRNAVMAIWNAIKIGLSAIATAAKATAAFFVAAWNAIVAAVTSVKTAIMGVVTAIVTWFTNAWNTVKSVVAIAISIIVGHIMSVVAVVVRVANAILAPYRFVWGLISLLAQVAFQLIRIAMELFVAIAVAVVNRVKSSFVNLWNNIKSLAAAAFAFVMARLQPLISVAQAVTNAIRSAFTAAFNAVRSAASAAASFVRSVWTAITGPIISAFSRIRSAVSSALNSIRSAASSAASSIKSTLTSIAGPVVAVASKIGGAFSSAFARLKGAAAGLTGALTAPFHAISGAISSAIGAVQNLISALSRIHVPSIKIPGGKSVSGAAAPTTLRSTATGLSAGVGVGARSMTSASSPGVVINVNGALDPDGVARQIERVLSSARTRRSGVTLRQRALGAAAA